MQAKQDHSLHGFPVSDERLIQQEEGNGVLQPLSGRLTNFSGKHEDNKYVGDHGIAY